MGSLLIPPELTSELASLLRAWCGSSGTSAPEGNRLIRMAAAMAVRSRRLRWRIEIEARRAGTSPESEAIDLVAPLFVTAGPDSPLGNALMDALPGSETALCARFKGAVENSVQSSLHRRWRENDPPGFKVYRNLMLWLNQDPRARLFPSDKPVWVTVAEGRDLRSGGRIIGEATLSGHLAELDPEFSKDSDLVMAALARVAAEPEFCAAVELSVLFAAVRGMKAREPFCRDGAPECSREAPPFLRIAIERAMVSALQSLRTRLKRATALGKLDGGTAEGFEKAIAELLADYAASGVWQDGYLTYVRKHCPQLTESRYTGPVQSRFEYLAQCAKADFEDGMRREYAP